MSNTATPEEVHRLFAWAARLCVYGAFEASYARVLIDTMRREYVNVVSEHLDFKRHAVPAGFAPYVLYVRPMKETA